MNTNSNHFVSVFPSSAGALPIGTVSIRRFQILLITSCMLINLWIVPVMATEPTAAPTTMPVLVVNVKQTLDGLTQAIYEAEKDECDLTIRYTVVQSMVGVNLDQVTEIVAQDVADDRYANARTGLSVSTEAAQCWLSYKLQTSDSSVTLDTIQIQLNGAVQSGQMDASLHFYAQQFNATSLLNSTLSAPEVTKAADAEHVDEDTAGELGGLVIGTAVFFALLVGLLLVYKIKIQHDSQIMSNAAKKEHPKKVEFV